ncbi:long-chain fatty acid--CoA ligase [Thiopseudomonas alkaliphila]|uniref:fatty acid--CoA ligase n=1 Tax=Thiopseudomonas alkaliphila TaxID=1697053 RepID=UPI00069ED065|nr:fatty acid--CoA ligase [Thiopseudomonas alkaliphila]AKX55261.1 long-chain fatty acid--CoA ligase [Thiopseudomonas alkaliphila]
MQTLLLPENDSAYAYPLLIKRLLMGVKRFEPNNQIVYRDLIRYDYATLYERVCRLANALTSAGIGAGDVVAVMDWDSHRYLECYFAVPMIGAVLHHVNIRLAPEQILYTMRKAEDKAVLVHDDFVPLLSTLEAQLPSIKTCIQLTDQEKPANCSLKTLVGEYESLLQQASSSYEFADFDENSVATLFFTTGTTGNPKGVYFTHRQLVLHSMNLVHSLSAFSGFSMLNSSSVYMPITPMFHVHAWGVPYAATMLGCKQVYPGRYEPSMLTQLLVTEHVTFSHCVPTLLQMIIDNPAAESLDLSNWKVVIGGSALTQGLAKRALERGIDIYSAYGMSETCPLITFTHLDQHMRQSANEESLHWRCATGVPAPMVEIALMDEQGNLLAHNGEHVGEIVIRSPWLTQGYYQEPEKSAELWQNGWLHTGDIGSIDQRGYLFIQDRLKDVIKTGGEWISSLDLEDLISQHPAIQSVAVVAIVDEAWGERPYALVVLQPEQRVTSEEIFDFLQGYVENGKINKWWLPKRIEVVADLPKTSVGKMDKKLIRQQLNA